jgi:hypothetical protein
MYSSTLMTTLLSEAEAEILTFFCPLMLAPLAGLLIVTVGAVVSAGWLPCGVALTVAVQAETWPEVLIARSWKS